MNLKTRKVLKRKTTVITSGSLELKPSPELKAGIRVVPFSRSKITNPGEEWRNNLSFQQYSSICFNFFYQDYELFEYPGINRRSSYNNGYLPQEYLTADNFKVLPDLDTLFYKETTIHKFAWSEDTSDYLYELLLNYADPFENKLIASLSPSNQKIGFHKPMILFLRPKSDPKNIDKSSPPEEFKAILIGSAGVNRESTHKYSQILVKTALLTFKKSENRDEYLNKNNFDFLSSEQLKLLESYCLVDVVNNKPGQRLILDSEGGAKPGNLKRMEKLIFRVAIKKGTQYAYSFFKLTEEGEIEFNESFGEVAGIFRSDPLDSSLSVWYYEEGSHWKNPKFGKMYQACLD